MFLQVLSNVSMTPICFGSDSESTSGGQMVPFQSFSMKIAFVKIAQVDVNAHIILICRQQYSNIYMN